MKMGKYVPYHHLGHLWCNSYIDKDSDTHRVEGQTMLTNGVANGELRNGWGILELWHFGKLLAVLVRKVLVNFWCFGRFWALISRWGDPKFWPFHVALDHTCGEFQVKEGRRQLSLGSPWACKKIWKITAGNPPPFLGHQKHQRWRSSITMTMTITKQENHSFHLADHTDGLYLLIPLWSSLSIERDIHYAPALATPGTQNIMSYSPRYFYKTHNVKHCEDRKNTSRKSLTNLIVDDIGI